MAKKHTYVLGTGLSHNGSACLIKDGKISVAIEKERITRVKHDGDNDSLAIEYCLSAEGIQLEDVDLVVQNSLRHMFNFGNDFYQGPRVFSANSTPVVTISHHLAHAYSAIGMCPYDDFDVVVMDGHGNSYDDCIDLGNAIIPDKERMNGIEQLFFEKDSYYHFSEGRIESIYKDFSEIGFNLKNYPMHPAIKNSIGALYGAASKYCFTDTQDVGKLMGLAPYGRPGVFKDEIFQLEGGRVFVNHNWMNRFNKTSYTYENFKSNFQYYADIAYWVQKEVERAVVYIINERRKFSKSANLCWSGGVALNAVANAKILKEVDIKNLFITPAAGDNGIAIGCAYYGWLEVLKKERVIHNGNTCFGKTYPVEKIGQVLQRFRINDPGAVKELIYSFFSILQEEKPRVKTSTVCFQFNILNFGVFQVLIEQDRITCVKDVNWVPQCTMEISRDDFFRAILEPDHFQYLYEIKRNKITGDKTLFDKFIDLDKISVVLHQLEIKNNNSYKLKTTVCDDYVQKTAELLANGKIVGWFQGGSEFGPRALGRRSILADPRNSKVRNLINSKIKFREDFRPFAPAVLASDVELFFEKKQESPYMILVNNMKKEWITSLRSVVHEDGTSRVQTVTPEWNPVFYNLLTEFKKLTDISVLLNTSFNRRGMPIVETPIDALEFFFSCSLDYLVMGNHIIEK